MASREQNVEWHIKFSRIGYLGAPTSTLQGFQDFFHQNVAVFITICMHLQLANHLAQCLRYKILSLGLFAEICCKGGKKDFKQRAQIGPFLGPYLDVGPNRDQVPKSGLHRKPCLLGRSQKKQHSGSQHCAI